MSAVLFQEDHAVALPGTSGFVGNQAMTAGVTILMAVLGLGGKTVYRKSTFQIMGQTMSAILAGVDALVSAYDNLSLGEPVKVMLKISHFLPSDALQPQPDQERSGYVGWKNEVNNRIKSGGSVWFIKPTNQIEELHAAMESALEGAGCCFAKVKQGDTMVDYVQYPCLDSDTARYYRKNELESGEVVITHPEDDLGADE